MLKTKSSSFAHKLDQSSRVKKILTSITLIIFLLFIAWVIYKNTEQLWRKPTVTFYNAFANQTINRTLFTLKGKVTKGDSLFINGNNTPLNETQEFSYDLVFGYGLTRVPVSVFDKFNKQNTVYLNFYRPRSE